MDSFVVAVYLKELRIHCMAAIDQYEMIMRHADNEHIDVEKIFSFIEDFALRAGNASKILWPQRDRGLTKMRGETLRQLIGVDRSHSLYSRDLRNHIEHWDERLDVWVSNNKNNVFVDKIIGPPGEVMSSDGSALLALRQFDPSNGAIYFAGEIFNINKIADGCKDILIRLDKLASSNDWNFRRLKLK